MGRVAKHDKGAKRAPGQESPSLSVSVLDPRSSERYGAQSSDVTKATTTTTTTVSLPLGLVARQPTDQRVKQSKAT